MAAPASTDPTTGASGLAPSTLVTCTYATVFDTRATRYFAVAPVYYFTNLLHTTMYDDLAAAVASNGGNGACCEQLGSPVAPTATASGSTGSVPCICLANMTLVALDKRFNSNPTLLGITFELNFAVGSVPTSAAAAPNVHALRQRPASRKGAAAGDAALRSIAGPAAAPGTLQGALNDVSGGGAAAAAVVAAGAANTGSTEGSSPDVPFVWASSAAAAFPHVRDELFKVLTRKDYLSDFRSPVLVFGHATLRDLRAMLDVDLDDVPRVAPTSAGAGGAVDYCRILSTPATALGSSGAAAAGTGATVTPPGSNVSYPIDVVRAAQAAYASSLVSSCDGSTCGVGILCAAVMVVLIVGATVAFAQQLYRRRKDEKADERQLLRWQLR